MANTHFLCVFFLQNLLTSNTYIYRLRIEAMSSLVAKIKGGVHEKLKEAWTDIELNSILSTTILTCICHASKRRKW